MQQSSLSRGSDMYILGCFFMIISSAFASVFAMIELMANGTPFMGLVLLACGACFVGGWAAIAMEFSDE